jgi:uncharacterized protein YkwD
MSETENEASKLQAVEYLNRIRGEEGIPPVQLIDLSVARFKAEYLARTNLFSHTIQREDTRVTGTPGSTADYTEWRRTYLWCIQ